MNIIFYRTCFFILLTLAFTNSCYEKNNMKDKDEDYKYLNGENFSTEKLDNILRPGVSVMEVKKKLGPPVYEISDTTEMNFDKIEKGLIIENDLLKDNSFVLVYYFIQSSKFNDIDEIHIYFKDSCVVKWVPFSHGVKLLDKSEQLNIKGDRYAYKIESLNKQFIQLLLVTESMTNISYLVNNSNGTIDANNLDLSNAMTVEADIVNNGWVLDIPEGYVEIYISWKKKDISILKNFFESHLGEKIFIIYKEKIIAAPTILGFSENMSFSIKEDEKINAIFNKNFIRNDK